MLEVDTKYDPDLKLWEGPKIKHLYNPKVSIGQVILNMLSLHGPKIAEMSDDYKVQTTFHELSLKTIRVAQNLLKFGFKSKNVMGIMTKNCTDVAPIVFASLCLGCPINPIDSTFGKNDLKSIISITKPNTFFCDVSVYNLLEACLNDLNITAQIFTFDGQRGKSIAIEMLFVESNNEMNFLPVDIDGEMETAIITASIGVTGSLEGVCLSHALLLDKCTRLNSIGCGDVLFTFSSLNRLSGIGNLLKATYFGGTRIITTKPYAPDLLLELIEKYKISHLFASSQHILLALNQAWIEKVDLTSVKSIALSGPKMSLEQYKNMKQYFKNATPYVMFGISELGGAISIARGDQLNLNGTGKLMNGIQVKIIDENAKRLGIGERGFICVKSVYNFLGYFGRDNVQSIIDDEQFVRTGHIGYFDNNGFLYVIGRDVDVIKYGNQLISLKEIEESLVENPNIEAVCVVDVINRFTDNMSLVALVVKIKNSTISEEEIQNLVSDKFDDNHKLRGGVYFVNSLPSTTSGKVIRRLARLIAEKEFASRSNALKTT